MLTRSKRDDIGGHATTGPIGPGSYDPEQPSFKPKSGLAPFGSTVERDFGGAVVIKETPGPGAYFDSAVQGTAASVRPSPAFHSKVARLKDANASAAPGPGSYFLDGDSSVKPKRHSAPAKLHSAEGINWVKVATAPSIPSRLQGFGYEEGPGGTLVQQPASVKMHTGVGADLPGPGEYDPKIDITKTVKGATNFGKSKAGRSSAVPPELASHPGPGAYKVEQAGTSDHFKGGVMNKHMSSMFASNSKRSQAAASNAATVPGPGAYTVQGSFEPLTHHLASHPESYAVFGRSSSHKTGPMTLTEDAAANSPGPGWYEPPVKARINAGHPMPPTAAFSSKEGRFGMSKARPDAAPGPGTYETQAYTMVRELSAKTRGGFGAFGSTDRRLSPPARGGDQPGPGAYDTNRDPANPADMRRKDARSSAFRSQEPRGQALVRSNAAEEPGPGAYNAPSQMFKKPTSTAHVFVNTSPRFLPDRKDAAPGPGQYDVPILPKAGVKPPVSMPKAGRFGHPLTLAKMEGGTPGPGSYNTVAPLLKKSFNMMLLEERLNGSH